jgi:DNA mismatch repair protein MutL
MGIINILNSATANKIAAGEIVERPVSVVKELLENSLDAQANFIEIEIADGGLSLIRVLDNGQGMDSEDAEKAFLRHATSKISAIEDLYNLDTFGFRGEALPSIAAVSQVVLTTCNDLTNTGVRLKLVAGEIQNKETVASLQGTTVEVRNLFFNTPGRRKFIKNRSYETGLITELVAKYSLGHPDVHFKLINNKEIVYDTSGLITTENRLEEIYGQELRDKFINIPKKEIKPGISVEAWLALPKYNRNTKNQQTFFINGRLIKCKGLNKVLEEAYHTLIPKGRFAIALIKLQMPGSELDVNIHPAKLEIKINNIDHIFPILVDLFKPKLWNTSIEANNPLFKEKSLLSEVNNDNINSFEDKKLNLEQPIVYKQNILPLTEAKIEETAAPVLSNHESSYSEKIIADKEEKPSFKPDERANKKEINLYPLAQLNNCFILAQDRKGLYIIDQHTCHERILYEKFFKEENLKSAFSEYLLIPLTLTLTGHQEGILLKNILILKELGFIVEYFGPRSFILRAIPTGLKITDTESFFLDLLEILDESTNLSSGKIKEKIITLASCKGAVKANQKLTMDEMQYLINELNNVDNPHTCPHGRPIIYHLSMEDLYKIFRRGEYRGD